MSNEKRGEGKRKVYIALSKAKGFQSIIRGWAGDDSQKASSYMVGSGRTLG